MNKIKVYALSDSIGETSELVSKAVLGQFEELNYEIELWSYIKSKERIDEAISSAKNENAIIVFTLVVIELRDYLIKKAEIENVTAIDLITPILTPLIKHLGLKPRREPGLLHKFDENYFKKIDAIEFAVKYDDGKDTKGILLADIVLIGISRTSKTPLSMYLANKNLKTANIPLVPEVEPPEELFILDPARIIGLYTEPEYLNKIRKERLKVLGLNDNATYANISRIIKELEYADKYMKKIGCRRIDITNKAVEETANIIMNWHNEITRKERE